MDSSELDITARLALLELTDEERAQFEREVGRLLEYFSLMDGVDVSGLEPTTHALGQGNRLRPDSLRAGGEIADEMLEQAPELEDRFVAIPNVL